MKSYGKIFFSLLAAALFVASTMDAKVKQTPLYMFGVAFSFTDSTAYITEISRVDTATMDAKTKFLMDYNLYSYQLEEHINRSYKTQDIISSVFYDQKKSKLEKKLQSVKNRQGKSSHWRLIDTYLPFHSVEWIAPEILTAEKPVKDEKDEKPKKSKKAKSQKK